MAQHDYNIANQTFPNTRSDINNALSAVASNNSGDTAPSTTFANQWFYETDTNLLQIRNEDNDAYITIAELDQSNDTVEYFKADSIRTALIEFTDGDDAITIADGGGCTFSAKITADAGIDIDNFNIDGTTIALSSGDITIDAAGRIDLSADDNGEVRLYDGSSMYGQFKDDGDNFHIQSIIQDKDIHFIGNDGGSAITAMAIDMSEGGNVGVNTTDPSQQLEVNVDNTTAIATTGGIGSTNPGAANGIGIHNKNNSGVYSGIAFETRTSGAARIALLNQWRATYIGDLDFQFRNGASANQNHVKFRASGEGEFYFGTELATDGTSPVNPVSSNSGGAEGFAIFAGSYMVGAINSNPVMYLNRMTTDGAILRFRAQGSDEGSIEVSGSTVSLAGFTGTHWSRLEDNSKPTILRGTIIESVDKMVDWYQVSFTDQSNQNKVYSISLPEGGKVGDDYVIADPFFTETKYEEVDIFYTEEDENIPEGKKIGDRKPNMGGKSVGEIREAKPIYTGKIIKEGDVKHVYSKVSDTADSKKVYGIFSHWDDDDTGDDGDVNDFLVAQVGTYIIRVNKDVTVEAGDLLVSNGDGTAKLQDDDIIRSKTVAKVNTNIKVETYEDGSYTVPCTLHC